MGRVRAAKRVAMGAAIAGAAGYLAGLLTAPSSGKKTRKALQKNADKGLGELEAQLKSLHSDLGDMMEQAHGKGNELQGRAQKKFSTALDGATTAKDKLRDVLAAVHEGEADNEDLQNALEDARRAVEHLKDFLTSK